MDIVTRNETAGDYRSVEELTREAFWDMHVPGCDEHYLAHIMRNHPDFIAQLDFVAVFENRIIGNIMYARSHVLDADDSTHKLDTITFGPISVLPEFQRRGIGSALIRHSVQKAGELGYGAIIIHGHPHNYCKHGFKNAKDSGISDAEGRYPYGLLVLVLKEGFFKGRGWRYIASSVYNTNKEESDNFDKGFALKEKKYRYTQEEFTIASRAYLE